MTTPNKSNRFDDYIRREVDDVSYSFSMESWSALETMLDQHHPINEPVSPSLIQRLLKWWMIGILALVLALAAFYYTSKNSPSNGQTGDLSGPISVEEENLSLIEEESELKEIEQLISDEQFVKENQHMRSELKLGLLYPLPTIRPGIDHQSEWNSAFQNWPRYQGEELLKFLDSLNMEKKKKYMIW